MCDTKGIVNGYKGVVVPDDERELGRGDVDSCCCCVTLWAAVLVSCSVPRKLGTGGRDSGGLVFTSAVKSLARIQCVKGVTMCSVKSTIKKRCDLRRETKRLLHCWHELCSKYVVKGSE